MSQEQDSSQEQVRFHGSRDVLDNAPESFQQRVIKALEQTDEVGIQIILMMEDNEKVPFARGIDNVFVTLNKRYGESFHRAGGKTYHIFMVGDGGKQKVRSIIGALGIHEDDSETIDAETAQAKGYPIRFKP